jgi:hypothetical protein
MRERRDLLTSVRAAILRVAFFAEAVLAMKFLLALQPDLPAPQAPHKAG